MEARPWPLSCGRSTPDRRQPELVDRAVLPPASTSSLQAHLQPPFPRAVEHCGLDSSASAGWLVESVAQGIWFAAACLDALRRRATAEGFRSISHRVTRVVGAPSGMDSYSGIYPNPRLELDRIPVRRRFPAPKADPSYIRRCISGSRGILIAAAPPIWVPRNRVRRYRSDWRNQRLGSAPWPHRAAPHVGRSDLHLVPTRHRIRRPHPDRCGPHHPYEG